jgi:prolyl-tRNA synthetase
VAPYEVVVTVIRADDEATMATANQLYDGFVSAGVDVLLDDRIERPGVKFADSELIGIPYRVTIGPKDVEDGTAEVTVRADMAKDQIALDEVVTTLADRITRARFGI